MHHSELPDWRISKAARIASVSGPQTGFGKPGDIVFLTSVTEMPKIGEVSFATPGPPSLALDASIRAAHEAVDLRSRLQFEDVPTGHKFVKPANFTHLFDYFERCMVTVTFAYQSLESYCNQIISDHLKGSFQLKRHGKLQSFTAVQLERHASTEEKLGVILPRLLGVKTPKGTAVWQKYVVLKRVRDSTIHLKSQDYYSKARPDRETLFYRFLNNEPMSFPMNAIAMIRHFAGPNATWLGGAEERLKAANPPDASLPKPPVQPSKSWWRALLARLMWWRRPG
jgi:hypothetical protein